MISPNFICPDKIKELLPNLAEKIRAREPCFGVVSVRDEIRIATKVAPRLVAEAGAQVGSSGIQQPSA